MRIFIGLLIAFIYSVSVTSSSAEETVLIYVKSKRGVSLPILFTVPDKPKAGVILFVGGNGLLKLSSAGKITENTANFFSRTHKLFANHDLMVALVDVPSAVGKVNVTFRISKKYAGDIAAIIKHMKKRADVSIWLVGTSMGSFSAASVGMEKQKIVAGIVLTSSVTNPKKKSHLAKIAAKYPDGVASMNLKKFKKPALIVSHKNDNCKVSPPGDAGKLKNKLSNSSRVKIVLLTGGKKRKSNVCQGLSNHGFFGIENTAVEKIADFILQ